MTASRPQIAFYGDDFTGSTAILGVLADAGMRAVLCVGEVSHARLAELAAKGYDAVGLAGLSRSLGVAELENELTVAFASLRTLGARLVHYKVCSTFDSSPEIGSIGRAIDVGQTIFGGAFVPVIVGAPAIGRFVAFGNLFVAHEGRVVRLDQYPGMRLHPITPMSEPDLVRHLAAQTSRAIRSLDHRTLASGATQVMQELRAHAGRTPDAAPAVVFDTITVDDLAVTGEVLEQLGSAEAPAFVVGSQGVEYALVEHARRSGRILGSLEPRVAPASRLFVVSGSCSSVTAGQIESAIRSGYADIALDVAALLDGEHPSRGAAEIERVVRAALPEIAVRHVVVHAARGSHDPRLSEGTRQGLSGPEAGRLIALALGQVARAVLRDDAVVNLRPRLLVCGGDTSGHVTRSLGIEALEAIGFATAGSPLCRAMAPNSPLESLELVLKGGQMGEVDLFESVRQGRRPTKPSTQGHTS